MFISITTLIAVTICLVAFFGTSAGEFVQQCCTVLLSPVSASIRRKIARYDNQVIVDLPSRGMQVRPAEEWALVNLLVMSQQALNNLQHDRVSKTAVLSGADLEQLEYCLQDLKALKVRQVLQSSVPVSWDEAMAT